MSTYAPSRKKDIIKDKISFINQHYNIDCVQGCRKYIPDNSIDLIITDPPYAINGDSLHRHYNRNENNVIEGYCEIDKKDYYNFSFKWILEAERVLKNNGSMYIVSGYTNLIDILNALSKTKLKLINHIIWKYNFGVYTKRKYISSHYHILFLAKNDQYKFNLECRYKKNERNATNNLNYLDREDVWCIKREYKPNQIKNKNQLPEELLKKMIQYSSNENDIICDFFLGSFSTSIQAIKMGRKACGFEINPNSYKYFNSIFQKEIKKCLNTKEIPLFF